MSELNLGDLANYRPTTINESKSAAMQQMHSCNSVLKELLRHKKPTSASLTGEPRKVFKPSAPRAVSDDDTFLGIFIRRKGVIGLVIGTGFNLPNPRLHWINIHHLEIPTQQRLSKWASDTFYAAGHILKTLGVSFCALVLQARRAYTGIDTDVMQQCANIPDVKFLQVSMTASVERILVDLLYADRYPSNQARGTIELVHRHAAIMQLASVVFETRNLEPHSVLVTSQKTDVQEHRLVGVATYLKESFIGLLYAVTSQRTVEFSNVNSEMQCSLEKVFLRRPDFVQDYAIYCGAKTSICVIRR
jgi:hypothetical protein